MGPVARSWFACLAVVFSACSAIVDFPDKVPPPKEDASVIDARVDAAIEDAGNDAEVRDARADAARDAGPECTQNTDCDNSELCCPEQSNVAMCVPSNVERCTACGVGCTDPRAPNCGARVCECVAGTGTGCDTGQTCDNSSGTARCVECAGDSDCAGVTGKTLCENNKCVACQRGDVAAPGDDKGCMDGRFPFCGADNTCTGCDDSKPETKCAEGTVCTPGVGCGGCKADVQTVGLNGCTMESLPICKTVAGGGTQCAACTTNTECKLAEGQGFCATGRCSNKCDGDIPSGANNGCTNPATPFCKPASNVPGGFDCAACTAADCANGTFCATTGTKAGSCVQCRSSIDCNPNGLAPVCDATSFTCRARTPMDCVAPTPFLSTTGATAGTCVACLNDMQCAAGQHCSPTKNTCGECADSSQCPLMKPTCNSAGAVSVCEAGCSVGLCTVYHAPATMCTAGTCVQCTSDLQCGNEAPLCEGGTCQACTAVTTPTPTPDARCATKTPSSNCITSAGPYRGRCGNCIPGVTNCPGATTCNASFLLCQ